jgi:hypothetical protein
MQYAGNHKSQFNNINNNIVNSTKGLDGFKIR